MTVIGLLELSWVSPNYIYNFVPVEATHELWTPLKWKLQERREKIFSLTFLQTLKQDTTIPWKVQNEIETWKRKGGGGNEWKYYLLFSFFVSPLNPCMINYWQWIYQPPFITKLCYKKFE